MLELFYLTSSSAEISNGVPTTTHEYALWEIIFWYAAFAVSLVIFIIYFTKRKTNKKKLDAICNKTSKEINRIDTLIKSFLSNPKPKKQVKDVCARTILTLSSFDIYFVELKEKTRLEDFDRILLLSEEIINELKNIRDEKEQMLKDLQKIQEQLIVFKGQVELVKSYLR